MSKLPCGCQTEMGVFRVGTVPCDTHKAVDPDTGYEAVIEINWLPDGDCGYGCKLWKHERCPCNCGCMRSQGWHLIDETPRLNICHDRDQVA